MASPKRRKKKSVTAARRRAGDAADLARFRDGVRVRATRMPDKKREASRRACRGATRRSD